MSANRLVLLLAVPLFLVLAVSAFLTARFAVSERDAQSQVRHTFQVIEAQRRIQDSVQTAETGMRGFLLSRDPVFEQGFRSYLARIPADIKRFRELSRDNPTQQTRADRLEALIQSRITGLNAGVANNTAPAITTPAAVEGLARGRQLMTQIRAEIEAGLAEEQRLLSERDGTRRQSEEMVVGSAIAAAVITLLVLLAAALLLVRNNMRLARAEKARANEAAILQATLELVRDGVAYFISDGTLCAYNTQFFTLLGLPRHLAKINTPIAQLVGAENWPFPVLAPSGADETGQGSQRLVWKDRELDIYKVPVSTGGFLIGVEDNTARLRAEAIGRQAQKMEAVGHLTGGVAHDFNNLLQIISANLDLAVAGDDVISNPRLAQRLQNAIGAVTRGSRLTAQLLAFARRQALDPRSLDLGRVIRDMTDLLRRALGERIAVETVIAGGLWNTLADPTQIENTILNLAINARDAMPDGGKLTLEVANAYLDDAYAATHAEVTPGQYVMLAVSDTGTGMTPEVVARVFEPFFTTKPEGKGTGLGLAQAYGFIKQTGGHIKIYTEPGHGTTIKLYLPRTRRERDALEGIGGGPAQGGSEHILVVEDDEGVRAAVVDMLNELGYRVSRAENAESALALLDTIKPDLIFTDVVMPGALHTREFTRLATLKYPGIKVLYTSGYTQNAIVHNGKLDDDAYLLSKPYRREELARKLRSVIIGPTRGPITPDMTLPDAVPAQALAPGARVLVVEDVALIRMTTVDMVEQLGFTALEAEDGPQALAILTADDSITVLLTDLGLPGMNGRQLVEETLKLRPGIKVIIASGYSTEAEEATALKGKVAYLTKPFDMEQLKRALHA